MHARLNAGKQSVGCDLKADPALGHVLCRAADVVVEGFRLGVAERLGVGSGDLPDIVVYCSIRGFGEGSEWISRVGHDVDYLGVAGVLDPNAPALPPPPSPTWRRARSRPCHGSSPGSSLASVAAARCIASR